ncbi:MAG: Hsp33 family molecular chaperone HslO [Pseudomonadales bacterium]
MSEDLIHRFSFVEAPIRGQWVRLEAVLGELFRRQPYPERLRGLLAEMAAAVSLMADNVKFHGAVSLQARGSGPVTTALAECRDQHLLRGLLRWDEDHAAPPEAAAGGLRALLGSGQMAITLMPEPTAAQRRRGAEATTYQGVVAVDEGSLAENLEEYFANSEQLPTRVFFSYAAGRVTGLLLQRLPAADAASDVELDQHDESWRAIDLLASTLSPAELATLPVQDLLRRLFHEHPLTLQPARPLAFSCTCSRERAERMLQALPKQEIIELLETQGMVDVTCEICGARYEYDQVDTHLIYEPGEPRIH